MNHLIVASVLPLAIVGTIVPDGIAQSLHVATVLTTAALIALAVRKYRPRLPVSWYLIAASLVAGAVGQGLYATSRHGQGSELAAVGVIVLAMGLGASGLFFWLKARWSSWNVTVLLDCLIVSALMTTVVWETVAKGNSELHNSPFLAITTFGAVFTLTPIARLTFEAVRVRALQLYFAGALCTVILQTMAALDVLSQTTCEAWLAASLLLFSAAAWHPTMTQITDVEPVRQTSVGMFRFILLGGALFVSPGVATIGNLRTGEPIDAIWVACSIIIISAVTRRMSSLLRERDANRDALATNGRRNAALAELGRRVLRISMPSNAMFEATTAITSGIDEGTVVVWEIVNGDSLVLRSTSDPAVVGPEGSLPADNTSFEGRAFIARQTSLFTDETPENALWDGDKTVLCCPVIGQDRAHGVVAVYLPSTALIDADEIVFVEQVANVIAICIDRAEAERDTRDAQKLEAVGRLAAGIAHEINTPVQFIGDNLYFLQDAVNDLLALQVNEKIPAEVDIEYLRAEAPLAIEQARDGVARVATIVQAMKAFGHPDQQEQAAADLNQALQNTLVVARNELKYVADVSSRYGKLPPIRCHIGELNQVFLNLLVNAAHAVSDKHGESGRGNIGVRTWINADFVYVMISDDGGGIPPNVRTKIWEPFFTTKEVGRGTGQGLALAKAVVERHNGRIEFETGEEGTVFCIKLPVNGVEEAGDKPAAIRPAMKADQPSSERLVKA